MSWAEVFKINSDMSKSLDKLIVGEKRLVASNAAIATAYDGDYYYYFVPKIDGVIRVKYYVENSQTSALEARLHIYDENDSKISSAPSISVAGNENKTFDYDFSVRSGKKYKIMFEDLELVGRLVLKHAMFCGQVTDSNYFSEERVN